jgi:N-acetylglucosaminyl-diphospho-decaprenol L-rhamnosyltransferase
VSSSARTTVVTVTYNSAAVIGAMLTSVPHGVPVIVVDNASTDGSIGIAEGAGAEIIRLEENKGFGPACNAGAALADTEFVFFVNPDAALAPECIEKLEAAADRYPRASAFNPRISDRHGGEYFKRSSKLIPRRDWMQRGWPAADREVTVLSGAALFCRRAAFEAIGGFDPAIFLYHEDDDLALRLKAECGPLMFIWDAAVTHQEGRGSPRSPEVAAIKSFHMARSRVHAMRKHGRPFVEARCLGSAIGKFANPAILFSRRKRAQAFGFFKGVVTIGRARPILVLCRLARRKAFRQRTP